MIVNSRYLTLIQHFSNNEQKDSVLDKCRDIALHKCIDNNID